MSALIDFIKFHKYVSQFGIRAPNLGRLSRIVLERNIQVISGPLLRAEDPWVDVLLVCRLGDTAWTKPLEKAQFYKLRLKTGKG